MQIQEEIAMQDDMRPPIIPLHRPSGTARPVTSGPSLLFPTDVVGLRAMAAQSTRSVARKISDQEHVIRTYEIAMAEMHERIRLLVRLLWVAAGLVFALVLLFVWRLW